MEKSRLSDADFGALSRCWHRLVGRIFEDEISQTAMLACLEKMASGEAAAMIDAHRRMIDVATTWPLI